MARNYLRTGFSMYDLKRAYENGYAKGWADAMAEQETQLRY